MGIKLAAVWLLLTGCSELHLFTVPPLLMGIVAIVAAILIFCGV